MFIKNKEWYKSKTIWAAIASLVVAILSAMFGESSVVVSLMIAVFSTLGLYGRINAQTQLK